MPVSGLDSEGSVIRQRIVMVSSGAWITMMPAGSPCEVMVSPGLTAPGFQMIDVGLSISVPPVKSVGMYGL